MSQHDLMQQALIDHQQMINEFTTKTIEAMSTIASQSKSTLKNVILKQKNTHKEFAIIIFV